METLGLAALIFSMRVLDVSMGTVRQIVAVQGRSIIASAIGFFEVLIFLVAISAALASVRENPILAVAYAGGFAAGTWLGVVIEARIALGIRLVRVITVRPNNELVSALREAGFGVTIVHGEGLNGPVYVLFSVVRRKLVPAFQEIVKEWAPNAFMTIEDTRFASGGIIGRKGK